MRQSLASSTAARAVVAVLLELGLEQFEQRERVGRRAGEAGQHVAFVPSRRTLRALAFITVLPSVTWPSPPITTLPSRRTDTMVVAWKLSCMGDTVKL